MDLFASLVDLFARVNKYILQVEVIRIVRGNEDRDKNRKGKDSDEGVSQRKEKAMRYDDTPQL